MQGLYKKKLSRKAQLAYLAGTCASFAKQEKRLVYYLKYILKYYGLVSFWQVFKCIVKNKMNRDSDLL